MGPHFWAWTYGMGQVSSGCTHVDGRPGKPDGAVSPNPRCGAFTGAHNDHGLWRPIGCIDLVELGLRDPFGVYFDPLDDLVAQGVSGLADQGQGSTRAQFVEQSIAHGAVVWPSVGVEQDIAVRGARVNAGRVEGEVVLAARVDGRHTGHAVFVSRQGEHRTALGDASDHDPGWDEGLIGRIGAINLWFGDLVRGGRLHRRRTGGHRCGRGWGTDCLGLLIAVGVPQHCGGHQSDGDSNDREDQDSAALIFCLLMWRYGHLWAAPRCEMC